MAALWTSRYKWVLWVWNCCRRWLVSSLKLKEFVITMLFQTDVLATSFLNFGFFRVGNCRHCILVFKITSLPPSPPHSFAFTCKQVEVLLQWFVSFVIAESAYWPAGSYGIPKATSGCPYTDGFQWLIGRRNQDTEDGNPYSHKSSGFHLDATVDSKRGIIVRSFCIKTDTSIDMKRGYWPLGKKVVYLVFYFLKIMIIKIYHISKSPWLRPSCPLSSSSFQLIKGSRHRLRCRSHWCTTRKPSLGRGIPSGGL